MIFDLEHLVLHPSLRYPLLPVENGLGEEFVYKFHVVGLR